MGCLPKSFPPFKSFPPCSKASPSLCDAIATHPCVCPNACLVGKMRRNDEKHKRSTLAMSGISQLLGY